MEYTVRWITQVDADSPQEAAELAAKMQRDPSTLSIAFEVNPKEGPSLGWSQNWPVFEVPWPEEFRQS
jgi:hypothetical protein